jgi:hypothetical protein
LRPNLEEFPLIHERRGEISFQIQFSTDRVAGSGMGFA